MSHDAFALSPISARAAEPSEADYAAICEAFMETARGRWFLGEYARRNRNADTRMVLDAVARIEETLARQKQQAPAPDRADAAAALVIEARRHAMAALATDDAEQAQRAIRKGALVIRDMSWTLRECGADPRVCDLLDAQVAAIDGGCDRHGTPLVRHDSVIAVFDTLAARLQALLRGDAVMPAVAEPPSESAAEPAADDAPQAGVAESVELFESGSGEPAVQAAESIAQAEEPWPEPVADIAPAPMAIAPAPMVTETAAPPAPPVADVPPPAPPAASPAPQTLGAALLSGGIVAVESARRDPLAPLRKLSQAEKIALFS